MFRLLFCVLKYIYSLFLACDRLINTNSTYFLHNRFAEAERYVLIMLSMNINPYSCSGSPSVSLSLSLLFVCVCVYVCSHRRQPGFCKICDDDQSIGFALAEAIAKKINKGMSVEQAKAIVFDEIKIKPMMPAPTFTTGAPQNRFSKRTNNNINVSKKRKAVGLPDPSLMVPAMPPLLDPQAPNDNANRKKKRRTN